MLSTVTKDLVLDVSGGSSKAGTNVQIYKNNGSNAQQWSLKKLEINEFPEGVYEIHPYSDSSKALDVASGSTANLANVQIYTSNSTAAQKYYVKSLGYGGYYKFINCASYKAVDIKGGSSKAGANIDIYTDNGTSAQTWQIIDTGKKDAMIKKEE